jgi:hypothetical protein
VPPTLGALGAGGLDRVRAALKAVSRRSKGSTVLEYRSYRHGLLQLKVRTYKTEDPERLLDSKLP